jgi:hypothetical protein
VIDEDGQKPIAVRVERDAPVTILLDEPGEEIAAGRATRQAISSGSRVSATWKS